MTGTLAAVREKLTFETSPGPTEVAQAMHDLGLVVTDTALAQLLGELRREAVGSGPLEQVLELENLTDVLVNGPTGLFVDRGQGLERLESVFIDDEQVRRLAVRLAAMVGRRLDDSSPFVDARLPDGTRLHAVLGSLTDSGTCISLRIPAKNSLTLADWVERGSMTVRAADILGSLVDSRVAFLVSGGTGTGKTTLLGTLLSEVNPSHRILIVEDSRELAPNHPHVLRLEARPPNIEGRGGISLTDLVRQALRMRPDRLVVGEVRGAEICDLLLALNTGHEGGCGTVHANSAADVPARLEALAALGGLSWEALHAQLASAIRVGIHISRLPDGRRLVAEIGVFRVEKSANRVICERAISWGPNGKAAVGPGYELLEALC